MNRFLCRSFRSSSTKVTSICVSPVQYSSITSNHCNYFSTTNKSLSEDKQDKLDQQYIGTLLPHHTEAPTNSHKIDPKTIPTDQISINETIADLPDLQPASSTNPPDTEITTLENGVRVVSQETFRQCTTLSALIKVGSRYETNETAGCTHLIEQMAFKSTTKRSHADVIRILESIGGVPNATASREEIVYSVDVLREHSKKAMEILGEVVSSPQILPEELEESREIIGFLSEMSKDQFSGNIQGNVMEELTCVAFGGGGSSSSNNDSSTSSHQKISPYLGRPLFLDPTRRGSDGLPAPNIDVVRQFHTDHFCGENIIISAAGLEHQEAVNMCQEYFGHLPKSSNNPMVNQVREDALVPNLYTGGCSLVDVPKLDFVHVGLGFETGGW